MAAKTTCALVAGHPPPLGCDICRITYRRTIGLRHRLAVPVKGIGVFWEVDHIKSKGSCCGSYLLVLLQLWYIQ